MKEYKKKRLSKMLLVLMGLIFISVFVFLIVNTKPPQYRTDLPCYDKEGNVIIGVSCEGYGSLFNAIGMNVLVGCAFLMAICLIIWIYLNEVERGLK